MVNPEKRKRRSKANNKEARIRKKTHAYTKRIYIHSLKPESEKTHKLRAHGDKAAKEVARAGGEFHEIQTVARAVTFPISANMVYVAKALHNKPHGQAAMDLKEAKRAYLEHGVTLKSVDSVSGGFSDEFVAVAHDNAADFEPFLFFDPFKERLARLIKKIGKETPHKRDLLETGEAKRATVGFVQGQSKHSKLSECARLGNKKQQLCFFQGKKEDCWFHGMDADLKLAVGKVATALRSFMEKHYQRDVDALREKLFGSRFAMLFGDDCKCDFEFADFFLESDSMLGRHIDCLNGKAHNYDFVASYSYCLSIDGKEHRMNVIMTYRKWCDANMRDMRQKSDETSQWELI